jgi:hypothetical protein
MPPAARLAWALHLAPTIGTRLLSGLAAGIPPAAWRSRLVIRALDRVGARSLVTGPMALRGRSPSGQRFSIRPRRLWSVDASAGLYLDRHMGPVVLPRHQDRTGDFPVPPWPVFIVGQATLQPDDAAPRQARRSAGAP